MKKFGVVCSMVLAALLCVSGITVFALSPEAGAANEEAQNREDVVFPAGEEATEVTPEGQEEVASEDQEKMEEEDPEQANEDAPAADEEVAASPFGEHWVKLVPYIFETLPADADLSEPVGAALYSPGSVKRESYPTMEELKQIRNMTYESEVIERFGWPDELVLSSGSGLYNVYKYLSSDGGYAIVGTHTIIRDDWALIYVESVEFSDEEDLSRYDSWAWPTIQDVELPDEVAE